MARGASTISSDPGPPVPTRTTPISAPAALVVGRAAVAGPIGQVLGDHGFAVVVASSVAAALDEGALVEVDVVVVDLEHDELDGVALCRHLRLRTRRPIVAVTDGHADARTVAALELGADDVVAATASSAELVARTRGAVRHDRAAVPGDDELLQAGLLRMDLASHDAMLPGHRLELTRKEFRLLALLARNPGKVLAHRVLLEEVWGPGSGMDTLRTHVSHLRRKVAAAGGGIGIAPPPGSATGSSCAPVRWLQRAGRSSCSQTQVSLST